MTDHEAEEGLRLASHLGDAILARASREAQTLVNLFFMPLRTPVVLRGRQGNGVGVRLDEQRDRVGARELQPPHGLADLRVMPLRERDRHRGTHLDPEAPVKQGRPSHLGALRCGHRDLIVANQPSRCQGAGWAL
jgi:hypothetical protein